MKAEKNRRQQRNFLINPKYQVRYIFWLTFTGMALIFINGGVFYLFIRENYKILVDMSPMEEEVKVQLYRELYQILFALGGFAVLFTLVAGIFGIVLSHRTAGPLFHFKRAFQEIRKGDLSVRVRLRPKDDFKDVADECNKMLDFLTERRS